jgi:Na+-transporting methylmalonyl-CoA/oxaloacetate decarboxylase gamma subunit
MKNLKRLLGWFDWSNYCVSWNYKLPQSVCPLFWRTIFGIILLPFTWITHVWNLITVKNSHYRDEFRPNHKLSAPSGAALNVITSITGIMLILEFEEKVGWDWFHVSDPLLLNYLMTTAVGALGVALTLLIFALLIYIIVGVAELCKKWFSKDGENTVWESKEPSAISKGIKSIKENYCPTINWDDIRYRDDK